MRKLVLFSYLFLEALLPVVWGQHSLFYEENFDSNQRKWPVKCTEILLSDIKNGYYELERFSKSGADIFLNMTYYNTKKDFVIEAKFRQLSCKDKHGFGISWDARDNRFSKNFLISPRRKFVVYHTKDGAIKQRKKWTKSRAINRVGKDNILRLQKKGKTMFFYINGQLLCTLPSTYAYGSKIGFKLNHRLKVQIDYIRVYQDDWQYNPQINLIEMTDEDKAHKKENLGFTINSSYTEKSPVVSPDGQILFINRHNHPRDGQGRQQDKIWYSLQDNQGNWTACQSIGAPLNNNNHNFVVSVSGDNNTVYLGNLYKADGTAGGIGLSVAHRSANGWQLPQKVRIDNFVNYNRYVNYFMTANRKILIAAIENKETYGSNDLVVYFEQDGAYVNPINLGPTINTATADFAPFLAADNKTLYFASSGHPGFGSADIFVSRRLDDSWTNWSKPQNLGATINTEKWEGYYKIPASGTYAYVVSDDHSLGKEDIFRIKLPEKARPEPVLMIYGKVLHAQTKAPIQTDIRYFDLATGSEEGIARSSPVDGSYKIILPYGKRYSFLAYKEDYYSISDFTDVSDIHYYTEIERNLYLNPLQKDQAIRLNNLFFDEKKAQLQKESKAELNRLAAVLKKHPTMKIEVDGYANTLSDSSNYQQLSAKRAQEVVRYLVENHGIKQERLISKGMGLYRAEAENNTAEQRKMMEFKIIEE